MKQLCAALLVMLHRQLVIGMVQHRAEVYLRKERLLHAARQLGVEPHVLDAHNHLWISGRCSPSNPHYLYQDLSSKGGDTQHLYEVNDTIKTMPIGG